VGLATRRRQRASPCCALVRGPASCSNGGSWGSG
jgi:hypothetical protein